MSVVTRFAPSPTGFLHIGGAHTALFNWLYARHHGGRFHLRIEDTDRARSTQDAIDAIVDGMRWLELDWDGNVVYQSARADRHAAVARDLLYAGKAYRCYCTADELTTMRQEARQAGRTRLYDGSWRDRDPKDAPAGVPPVVRIKMPLAGETRIADLIQGEVRVANDKLDDFILLRADGTPTYMLSVVVDDHDMTISHVIRGDDHLTNAFRQFHLFAACGWQPPQFAHMPLIHGADGAKLSKRHGALGVEAYRDLGLLPAALRNHLLRLGWSHGDDEVISTAQAIDWFDLDGVGRSPARFDMAKLENLNGAYMRACDDAALVDSISPLIEQILGETPDEVARARLLRGMPELKQRAKTIVELADIASFYCCKVPLKFNPKAQRLLDEDARARLAALRPRLAALGEWNGPAIEQDVREWVTNRELKLGAVAQPLRAALTGSTTSPGIFAVMEVLGPAEVLARIDAVIEHGAGS